MKTPTRPPAIPTVQCETARVKVTEWRLPPGTATGWHRHAHDYVVVPMTDGTLTAVGAAETVKNAMVKGRSYAGPLGREHDVVNESDREIVFVEIELKEPPRP